MNPFNNKPPKIMTPEEMQAKRDLDAKPFSEITDSQKIDRLVEYIENLFNGQGYQGRTLNEVQTKLRMLSKHSHNEGKLVVDLETVQNNHGGSGVATMGRTLPSLR